VQVSKGGGKVPRWSPKGDQLFFTANDQRIIVSGYHVKDGLFQAGSPKPWSTTRLADTGVLANFDIATAAPLPPSPAAVEFALLQSWLSSSATLQLPLHAIEAQQSDKGREVLRLLLLAHLQQRGNGDVGPLCWSHPATLNFAMPIATLAHARSPQCSAPWR
jgi:hypothetical protein